jgi:hypothetical protein
MPLICVCRSASGKRSYARRNQALERGPPKRKGLCAEAKFILDSGNLVRLYWRSLNSQQESQSKAHASLPDEKHRVLYSSQEWPHGPAKCA